MTAARTLRPEHNRITLASRSSSGSGGSGPDPLAEWQTSLANRVALQAEIVWPAMSDGYLQGGAADVARPFSRVWWRLGPVKTQHCDDCPWMAFNSPYGAPGSGENELWQVPGDGRTACGAGCKCSLELGWEEMPASGNYDWTDFLPPDMYTRNPSAKLPTSEQGTGGLLPGDVARGPIAVDANGQYVYGGTSAERAYYAQVSPHETPYGALSESLAVLPPPSTLAGLDAGEIHAMDDFRSAWFHWDAVRGELPPAPTLFGAETAPMLQSLTRRRYLVRGKFPSWDALTAAQQEALQEVYDAVLEWNAARSGLDTADVEEGALAGAGVGMSEPRDWVRAVALRNDDHSNHGKFTYTGGPGSQGGRAEGEGEGEAGRAGGHAGGAHEAEHNTAERKSGGQRKYTGAKMGPAQRAQQERGLAEDRAQLLKVEHALGQHDAFLAGHEATHSDYERISEQRMRLASAHEALQERINARETLLGMRGEASGPRDNRVAYNRRARAGARTDPAWVRWRSLAASLRHAEAELAGQRPFGQRTGSANAAEAAQRRAVVEARVRELRPQVAHAKAQVDAERAAAPKSPGAHGDAGREMLGLSNRERALMARLSQAIPARERERVEADLAAVRARRAQLAPELRDAALATKREDMKARTARALETPEQRAALLAKWREEAKRAYARKQERKKAAQQEQQQASSEQMHELVLPWEDAWDLLMPDPALVRLVEDVQ